jgi:hypothetical protein
LSDSILRLAGQFKEDAMARNDHGKGVAAHMAAGNDRTCCGPDGMEADSVPLASLVVERLEAWPPSWESAWIDLGGEG